MFGYITDHGVLDDKITFGTEGNGKGEGKARKIFSRKNGCVCKGQC